MNDRQRAFALEYLRNGFNAVKAARAAGYADPDDDAYRIRKDPEVDALIREEMERRAMGADEVLARLGAEASFDITEFADVGPRGSFTLNLKKAERAGKLHLVTGYDYSKQGKLIVKFPDKQAALLTLARHHKLLTDRVETSAPDALNLIREYLGMDHGDSEES